MSAGAAGRTAPAGGDIEEAVGGAAGGAAEGLHQDQLVWVERACPPVDPQLASPPGAGHCPEGVSGWRSCPSHSRPPGRSL